MQQQYIRLVAVQGQGKVWAEGTRLTVAEVCTWCRDWEVLHAPLCCLSVFCGVPRRDRGGCQTKKCRSGAGGFGQETVKGSGMRQGEAGHLGSKAFEQLPTVWLLLCRYLWWRSSWLLFVCFQLLFVCLISTCLFVRLQLVVCLLDFKLFLTCSLGLLKD